METEQVLTLVVTDSPSVDLATYSDWWAGFQAKYSTELSQFPELIGEVEDRLLLLTNGEEVSSERMGAKGLDFCQLKFLCFENSSIVLRLIQDNYRVELYRDLYEVFGFEPIYVNLKIKEEDRTLLSLAGTVIIDPAKGMKWLREKYREW